MQFEQMPVDRLESLGNPVEFLLDGISGMFKYTNTCENEESMIRISY
jgi:hypothetical protein